MHLYLNNTHFKIIAIALPGHAAQSRAVSMETGLSSWRSLSGQSGKNTSGLKHFFKLLYRLLIAASIMRTTIIFSLLLLL